MPLARRTATVLALLALTATLALGQPAPLATTAFTRDWLRSTNAADAGARLGVGSATNAITLFTNQTLYVLTNGSDGTAIRGRVDKAFATVGAAAIAAKFPGDQILVGPGWFYEPTLATISNGVALRGSGKYMTHLTLAQGGPTNSPTGDALILSGNAAMADLHLVMTQAWAWVDCGDTLLNDTNRISNCWIQGNSDIFYLNQLDGAHQIGLVVDGCDLESGWDFVLFNSQSASTNGAYIAVRNSTLTENFSRFPYPWLYTTQSRGINLGLNPGTGYLQYQNNLVSWLNPFGTNIAFIFGNISNMISAVAGVTFNYKGTNLVVQNFPALRSFLIGTNGNTGFVAQNSFLSNGVSYVDTVTAGTNLVANADGRTLSVADPENLTTINAGTLVLTNPPNINGSGITNLTAVIVTASGLGSVNSNYTAGVETFAVAVPGSGISLSNLTVKGDAVGASNVWFFQSALTMGTNVSVLLTNTSGATLYWNAGTLSGTNLSGGANFFYSDFRQTNFLVQSATGTMETNTTGCAVLTSDAAWGSNRLTGFYWSITNGAGVFGGAITANSLNGTNGLNVAAQVAITSSDGHQMQYAYLTNGFYSATNAFLASTEVVNMNQPVQTLISITNVNILGFANVSNTVMQEVWLCITNSSTTNYNVSWVAGTHIMGDVNSTNASTCFIPTQKEGWFDIKIIGGWMTNIWAYYRKN